MDERKFSRALFYLFACFQSLNILDVDRNADLQPPMNKCIDTAIYRTMTDAFVTGHQLGIKIRYGCPLESITHFTVKLNSVWFRCNCRRWGSHCTGIVSVRSPLGISSSGRPSWNVPNGSSIAHSTPIRLASLSESLLKSWNEIPLEFSLESVLGLSQDLLDIKIWFSSRQHNRLSCSSLRGRMLEKEHQSQRNWIQMH